MTFYTVIIFVMNKVADLIIPYGGLPEENIVILGKTLSEQTLLDRVEITFVDDNSYNFDKCSQILSSEFSLEFNSIFSKVNRGPGFARQLGLDSTSNEFVLFLDADDIFVSKHSLNILIYKTRNCDFLYSRFIEFDVANMLVRTPPIKDYDISSTIVKQLHGMVVRRSFLRDNNIRFPNLYINEDKVFIDSILLSNPKKEFCSKPQVVHTINNNCNQLTSRNQPLENIIIHNGLAAFYLLRFIINNGIKEFDVAVTNVISRLISLDFYSNISSTETQSINIGGILLLFLDLFNRKLLNNSISTILSAIPNTPKFIVDFFLNSSTKFYYNGLEYNLCNFKDVLSAFILSSDFFDSSVLEELYV